jgi:hypothetical protein
MPNKKLQDLNINKPYFCKSDTNRRNFNWRSRYKNLFNVLNYIIYGVKHKLTKLRMLWTHCMRQTRGSQEPIIAHLDQSCFQYQRNSTVAAILAGERNCRTPFWKRTIQWLFHQSLVLIELLVPDKMVLCEFPIASYVKLSTAVQPSWSEGGTTRHTFGSAFQRRRFKCDLLSKYA